MKKNWIIIISIIVLVLAGFAAWYFYLKDSGKGHLNRCDKEYECCEFPCSRYESCDSYYVCPLLRDDPFLRNDVIVDVILD